MLVVIRIRGRVGVHKKISDTFRMLKLNRLYSMSILPKDVKTVGMIQAVENHSTWGELSEEMLKKIKQKFPSEKNIRLSSPRGGFKAIKMVYPKGDLGYRGDKINELIERMLPK
jgi:large subunit ribosomal protein L30